MGLQFSREPEIARLRKFLPIFLLLSALITAVCVFSIIPDIGETFNSISAKEPIIRVAVGYVLVMPVLPLMLVTSAVLVIKSIPYNGVILIYLIKILNCLVFASALFIIFIIPAATWYQYRYLESIGYSRCSEIQGRNTMWFNDWIRNPEWCVRGKDRAWVLEQAQKQAVQK
ncbi:hypothetical protein [Paracidovorax avenae]|uniref:hypothetical protein n=1 Tax=Paracidovorax avenae TaxID=80867 RepID=UPI00126018DF|nr:hypothetical protein [Paracidovorax avenae]